MQSKHYITLGISAYLLFLLSLTPAATIFNTIDLPKNQLQVDGIEGTLWQGQAQQIRANKQVVQNFSWNLKLLNLFLGKLASDVAVEYKGLPVDSSISVSLFSQLIELNETQTSISATELQSMLDIPFGELDGNLSLDLPTLSFTTSRFPENIEGSLQWSNAALTLGNKIKLGNIKMMLGKKENGELEAIISNTKGEVIIKGNATLSKKGQYLLNMTLEPRSNASEDLRGALRLIAPRKKKNAHLIRQSGNLSRFGIKL